MTYYLHRHLVYGVVDTIRFTAIDTREAIMIGNRLHKPRYPASYALVCNQDGSIIATLPSNDTSLPSPIHASGWSYNPDTML